MSRMVKLLQKLGVDLFPEAYKAYKFTAGESGALMPLNVDVWNEGGRHMVALSHYGEQNGDAMADPDILAEAIETQKFKAQKTGELLLVKEIELIPIHYQNDYVGIFQQARFEDNGRLMVSPSLTKSIRAFLESWAGELAAHEYKAAPNSGSVGGRA